MVKGVTAYRQNVKSEMNVQEELLGCTDAGRLLKVGPQRVRQLERTGRLSAMRTAGGWRLFRRDDVERLAAERELKLKCVSV